MKRVYLEPPYDYLYCTENMIHMVETDVTKTV